MCSQASCARRSLPHKLDSKRIKPDLPLASLTRCQFSRPLGRKLPTLALCGDAQRLRIVVRTTERAGRHAELCQGQRHRLFPPPLRLQNQFYNFARSTAASRPPRYIVADRF
jgi:hypothetical protein